MVMTLFLPASHTLVFCCLLIFSISFVLLFWCHFQFSAYVISNNNNNNNSDNNATIYRGCHNAADVPNNIRMCFSYRYQLSVTVGNREEVLSWWLLNLTILSCSGM